MISTDLLKYLAYVWVTGGYDEFKSLVKDLDLIKKGFKITEIRKSILNDRELMRYYIQNSTYEIKENPVYKTSCQKIAKECLFWYEDNSHKL
jgi:hypothetical protein